MTKTAAKFRRGDRVSVEGVVDYVFDADSPLQIKVKVDHHDIYTSDEKLTMVRPDLKVGDRVSRAAAIGGKVIHATIVAENGDRLWVDVEGGHMDTWLRSEVQRVDPVPDIDEECERLGVEVAPTSATMMPGDVA